MPGKRKKRKSIAGRSFLRSLVCLTLVLLLGTAAVSAGSAGAYGRAVNASGSLNGEAAVDLLEFLDGCRIRSIIRDSRGRLWLSTWRTCGLLRYDRGVRIRSLEKKHQEEKERERISTELQMASRIQGGMLPHEFPPFPDRKEFSIYASMDPAREVGGDFCDFFLIDDDHLCMMMAANAMFSTELMLEALNEDPEAPLRSILENVRRATDRFVKDAEQFDDLTMLCIEYDGSGGPGPDHT